MFSVLRVENDKGQGPYDWTFSQWRTKDHNTSPKTPAPFYDKRLSRASEHLTSFELKQFSFGFKNLKQLKNWFSKRELKNLKKLGFKIVGYKTKEVIKGDKQLVFKKAA